MNHSVRSLIFVVEHSVGAVENFTAQLDQLTPGDKRIPPLLKSLSTEADVLSSALVAASKHVESLPEDDTNESQYDPELLSQAKRLFAAIEFGFCPRCGNVNTQEIAPLG